MKAYIALVTLLVLSACGGSSSRIHEIPANVMEQEAQNRAGNSQSGQQQNENEDQNTPGDDSRVEEELIDLLAIHHCRLKEVGNLYQTIVRWAAGHKETEVKAYDKAKKEASLPVMINAISDLSGRALSATVDGRQSLEKLEYPEKGKSVSQLQVITQASEYLAQNLVQFASSSEDNIYLAVQCGSREFDCMIEVIAQNLITAAQILGPQVRRSPNVAIKRYRDCR